ncbi:MAG TPA: shikimate kinase [Candidatus Bathyarchaeia archaeon]|jgi:XRE family aerobic/anaerobic benzoate catabolism transcriptional regulator|nr:shikimate kinase [Candidatus Bathyarchaeia archaeon]
MTLLERVAARVRRLREARAMSRPDLAARSGLSVRFLARIEAGDGNISLLRLSHLAEALDTTPEALLRAPREPGALIALVGMRGAGKSTIGPALAARLDRPFLEMDALIQDAAGLPLDQIFELHGERYYRKLERETMERILDRERAAVIAAAGGVVNEPTTWRLLLERTTVVWLRARPEDHWSRVVGQGDRRPMADHPDAMAELRAMLSARQSRYAQAHVVVDTSERDPGEIVEAIATEIEA